MDKKNILIQDSMGPSYRVFHAITLVTLAISAVSMALALCAFLEAKDLRETVNGLQEQIVQLEFASLHLDQETLNSRSKRSSSNERLDGVQVYDQAYGGSFKSQRDHRLKLYKSLEGHIPQSGKSLKPHHMKSAAWADDTVSNSVMPNEFQDKKIFEIPFMSNRKFASSLVKSADTNPRPELMRRASRVKRLHANNGPRNSRRQKQRNTKTETSESVLFRPSLVKTTSRINPAPPVPIRHNFTQTVKVPQNIAAYTSFRSPVEKKKKLNKKNRKQRKSRGLATVAHFHLTNDTQAFESDNMSWNPALWMESLGLNRKYHQSQNGVLVKEAGLYHIYAQLTYEGGMSVESFTVVQDNIDLFDCKVPAPLATLGTRTHSCHTSATTYLPQNAVVKVVNNPGMNAGIIKENSFFGLIKLMDAPNTAEKLLVG